MLKRLVSAITLAVAVSGCAHAYAPQPQILSELPADAPDGECYARVQVPGQPAPPQLQGAQWIQMPGPPGAPGPIWCLVPTGPQPVAFEAPRYGFVRVLCDDDYTPGRVSRLQQQLHQGGYYSGGYSGQYDAATAAAVTRFQSSHHIAHGGYLSMDTIQALDSAYAGQSYASQSYGGGYSQSYAGGYASSYSGGYGYAAGGISPCATPCAMPAPLPPPPPPLPCQPCVPVPPPCNPCAGVVYGGGYGGGYGGAYASAYAGGYASSGYVGGGVLAGGVGYQSTGGGYYAGPGYGLPPAPYASGAAYSRSYTVQGGGYSTWGGYRR